VSLPATLVTGTSASKINVTTTDGTPGSPVNVVRRNSDKALTSNLKLKDLKYLIKIVNPGFPQKKLKQIINPKFSDELLSLEDKLITKAFKIGVLYCKEGQIKEEQMFSNCEMGSEFEEFLNFLGDRIPLKSWPNFKAGLDTKENMTGNYSVYTRWQEIEIMFHVSTLLPFTAANPQQIERKRHIGNDVVVIIFNEGSHTFVPSCMNSEFNHVFAVIQVDRDTSDAKLTSYKLAISAKEGVPPFAPPLPYPAIFKKGVEFRDFLFRKIINAEQASYQAPVFAQKFNRTRDLQLEALEMKYAK